MIRNVNEQPEPRRFVLRSEVTADSLSFRGRTAMFRSDLSRPVSLALADGLFQNGRSFFDFGCGRGTDIGGLRALGIDAAGWDPVHQPDGVKTPADVVNLGYVVNVIESPAEREQALLEAWALTRQVLVVSARLDWDVQVDRAVAFGDGVVTSRGTFQKFYTQEELRGWIETTLDAPADAAGPGVFYIFRTADEREGHLARTVRRPRPGAVSVPPAVRFEQNREVLEPLLDFLCSRGRPPVTGELGEEQLLIERVGSLTRAVALLSRIADPKDWERVALARQRDLLVYLSLGRLRRFPKFTALPSDLRADIKAFFGSYSQATKLGTELLFAAGQQAAVSSECTESVVGKLTPDALYVHVSAVDELPVLLRVYEGCARTLLGEVQGATVVKLRRDKPKVSYLCYPEFDTDPHPALAETFVADLRELRTHHRDYTKRDNPPILHRKECFVSREHPLHQTFASLTTAEVEAGLLSDAADIGTRQAWQTRLTACGYTMNGHDLVKT